MSLWNVKVGNSDLIASIKMQIKCNLYGKQVLQLVRWLQIDRVKRSGGVVEISIN